MVRKFFQRDKNYILEEVQLSLQEALLEYLVDFVKVQYMLQHNPLGLVDDTVRRIESHREKHFSRFEEFYINLAGIFRYKYYADNQLEFLFDGRDPREKYADEWTTTYKSWVKSFCQEKRFVWGVLELTVFYPREDEARFIGNRLQQFISDYFEVKIHPNKGIMKRTA